MKHDAVFRGRILNKSYYIWRDTFNYEPTIRDKYEVNSHEDFYWATIDSPILQVGENIYIEDVDSGVELEVEKVVRSLSGEYIYYVDYIIETIDDQEKYQELEMKIEKKKSDSESLKKQMKEDYEREVLEKQSKKLSYRFLKLLGLKG